jgi:hypothetical protein
MNTTTTARSADERLQSLEAAVARLTVENLRYRRSGRAAMLLAAAALLIAPMSASQPAGEIRAKRFVLVDDAGGTRGVLSVTADGSSALVLSDGRQRTRLVATVSREGTTDLTLSDSRDKPRLIAGVDASSTPFLSLRNAESTSASASLAVVGPGNPVLRFADPAGRPRFVTSVIGDDVSLSLAGTKNRHAVVLAVESQTARLSLADSTGTDRLWAAIRSDSPVLQFLNVKGVPRSGLSTINDDEGVALISQSPGAAKPGAVLYGKDLKVLWSAPDK